MKIIQQVTVYIPTKNRCQLLQRAVNSVLAQSYPDFELVIVDDGSTDGTSDYLDQLSLKDKRVRYFTNQQSRGACYSRNIAIENAKGYFITGLDDDDYFCEERISHLVAAYDEKYAFVCANIFEMKDKDSLIARNFGYRTGEFGLEQMLNYNLVGNQILTTKEKFNEVDAFDIDMPAFQDYDTWVRLLRKTPVAFKIPERNYVLETEHGNTRISSCCASKVLGIDKFISKNEDIMSNQHLISMQVMKCKVSNSAFGLRDLLRAIHMQNYKSVINLYLSKNMAWLKKIVDRSKKTKVMSHRS